MSESTVAKNEILSLVIKKPLSTKFLQLKEAKDIGQYLFGYFDKSQPQFHCANFRFNLNCLHSIKSADDLA